MRDDLHLIRRWRDRVPAFASARHDAVAAAAYLLWKRPIGESSMSREVCNELCASLQEQPGDDGARRAVQTLEQ